MGNTSFHHSTAETLTEFACMRAHACKASTCCTCEAQATLLHACTSRALHIAAAYLWAACLGCGWLQVIPPDLSAAVEAVSAAAASAGAYGMGVVRYTRDIQEGDPCLPPGAKLVQVGGGASIRGPASGLHAFQLCPTCNMSWC